MTDYTPEFLAAALIAYMDSFQVYQEDLSDYNDETGEREGPFKARHVFVGHEIPSMQGFSVHMKTPIRKLQAMYNSQVAQNPDCPWVNAVDVFKSFMETTIASAAAFDLINAGFAKDVMKQWLGWKTDTILVDDASKATLTPTEAANRIQSILAVAFQGRVPVVIEHETKPVDTIANTPLADTPVEETKDMAVQRMAETIAQKRRPRKVTDAN